MKPSTLLLIFTLLVFSLTACVPAAAETPATPTSVASVYLDTEFTDAASLRNQLALGILKLDGTPQAITPEQAAILLPLWQATLTLMGDTTTAEAELTAIQNQIVVALTPEQLTAIAALQLTNADLKAYYAEYGLVLPTPAPGVTKVPGQGNSGLTQTEREATKAAAEALGTPVGTGSSSGQSAKTLLYEKVIEMLATLVGG